LLKKLDMVLLCGHGGGVANVARKIHGWRDSLNNLTQGIDGLLFDMKLKEAPKFTSDTMVMNVRVTFFKLMNT